MKAALVTGSSRGIGLGVAKELAARGFSIALNATDNSDALHHACEQIESLGVKAVPIVFDVADCSRHAIQIEKIARQIGPIHCLVNNAGVSVLNRSDLLDVSEQSYDRCFAVNTRALFFLSQAFARYLLAQQRDPEAFYSIVNITSANATAVALNRGEYCASKAAAAMISRTFAARLGPEEIAVYDVQPGLINTDMTAAVIEQYANRARDGLTLIPRVGQPEDVGRVVAELACGNLPYTTGQVISVDGGMLVSRF